VPRCIRFPAPRGLISLLVTALLLGGCGKRDERIDVSRFVTVYPGSPIVELPGAEGTIKVTVRNVSEIKLTELRLQVKSPACRAVKISPDRIPELTPADRKSFTVQLFRDPAKPRQRYPLFVTLRAVGLPVPAGLDLMVDTSPPPEKGWIDVGQVTLVSGGDAKRIYYLLGGAPILLILVWWLWRRRRESRSRS
jgi:hypothetical protein